MNHSKQTCSKKLRFWNISIFGMTIMAILFLGMPLMSCAEKHGSREHSGRESSESHSSREGRGEHSGREGKERSKIANYKVSGEHGSKERGEHDSDGEGHHDGEEGEESNKPIVRNGIFNEVRKGVHLMMAYDEKNNTFKGTLRNKTEKTIKDVCVEIHLSNKKEIGPTKKIDLKPGEASQVTLKVESTDFETWSAHAEVGKGHGNKGEETGTALKLTEKHDEIHYGAHLVLGYDKESNSFKGVVTNTTDQVLDRVRVEIHQSNGKELGPTKPEALQPGESRAVVLKAEGTNFDGWSTHAEVGNMEHGENGEGHDEGEESGEHEGRESGEHEGRESREHEGRESGEHSSKESSSEHSRREGGEEHSGREGRGEHK